MPMASRRQARQTHLGALRKDPVEEIPPIHRSDRRPEAVAKAAHYAETCALKKRTQFTFRINIARGWIKLAPGRQCIKIVLIDGAHDQPPAGFHHAADL